MKIKLCLKYLIYILLTIIFFLSNCYIKLGHLFIYVPYFYIGFLFFLSLFLYFLKPSKNIKTFFKTKSFLYFISYIIWIFGYKIILLLTGNSYLNIFYTLMYLVLLFFIFIFFIPAIINFKKLTKVLILLYFFILLFGVIEFFAIYYGIEPIVAFFDTIVNRNLINGELQQRAYNSFGFPRASSSFLEPSHLAFFIILSCPIVYCLCTSKYNIFNNLILDKFIKKSILILTPICLIFTQSPIYLIIGLIILFRTFIKGLSNNLPIKLSILTICLPIFFLLTPYLFSNESFLSRIFTVIANINIHNLVFLEPSLATRIINFYNQIIVFFKYPIAGVGIGNLGSIMPDQWLHSPIPITPELLGYANKKTYGGGQSIFFSGLAETGLIGVLLFYSFLFSLFSSLNKSISFYTGIEKDLFKGLKYFMIIFLVLTFYDSYINLPITTFYLSLIQTGMVYRIRNDESA